MSEEYKKRLDVKLVELGLVNSRSQAESYIKLSKVKVDGKFITKPGHLVSGSPKIIIEQEQQYVSRAALKLESIAKEFKLDFRDKKVLDVGSSTGGFTDYALRHGSKKVFAVEVGKDQMHQSLRVREDIELFEKTDILDVSPYGEIIKDRVSLSFIPDIIILDLSFVPLKNIMPHIYELSGKNTIVIPMVKPQFEAIGSGLKHKGVIKNEKIRRGLLKDFEIMVQNYFVILNKSDSKVAGSKGNLERFYLLKKLA